jgi:segregation and condensation protein B
MYATTRQFLDYFNLQSLEDLPPLAEIKELDNLSGDLPLEVLEVEAGLAADDEPESTEADAQPESDSESGDSAQGGAATAVEIDDAYESVTDQHESPDTDNAVDLESDTAETQSPPHADEASIEETPSEQLEQESQDQTETR